MDELAAFVFKGAIAGGIIAWTIGHGKPSKYRAGRAKNMKEEFAGSFHLGLNQLCGL